MMEAERTSETLVNFYQTTRSYNPEYSHLRVSGRKIWCLIRSRKKYSETILNELLISIIAFQQEAWGQLRICAVYYKLKFTQKWYETEMAGTHWLNAYLKLNSSLSIRRPETTSLARAMNFNRANVTTFFSKYVFGS
jgi:hypothetical protein